MQREEEGREEGQQTEAVEAPSRQEAGPLQGRVLVQETPGETVRWTGHLSLRGHAFLYPPESITILVNTNKGILFD